MSLTNPCSERLREIEELASCDVVVRHCWVLWRRGEVDWEQALVLMVKNLSEGNRHLTDQVVRLSIQLPPAIIVKGGPEK